MIIKSNELESRYNIKNEFITYGINKFSDDSFQEIHNIHGWNKPYGGLWASPINSDYGWINWVMDEGFNVEKYRDNFIRFSLKDESKIMVIDSISDLSCCILIRNSAHEFLDKIIDFKSMSRKVDSILLTLNGFHSLRRKGGDVGCGFQSWDCESIIILNKECINLIK